MKTLNKILLSLAILAGVSASASAKGFLIKGGVEFPHYNVQELGNVLDFSNVTGWHAGVGFQTGTFAGFSIQPEVLYQHSGLSVAMPDDPDDFAEIRNNNIQIVANVQWGVDLVIFRPFIFAAPFASYNIPTTNDLSEVNFKRWDYGIGAGIGFDIWKLQITGKYNWAFGGVIDWNSYVNDVKNINANTGSIVVSLAFKF